MAGRQEPAPPGSSVGAEEEEEEGTSLHTMEGKVVGLSWEEGERPIGVQPQHGVLMWGGIHLLQTV